MTGIQSKSDFRLETYNAINEYGVTAHISKLLKLKYKKLIQNIDNYPRDMDDTDLQMAMQFSYFHELNLKDKAEKAKIMKTNKSDPADITSNSLPPANIK